MNFLDYLLIGMNLSAAYLCAIMIHDAGKNIKNDWTWYLFGYSGMTVSLAFTFCTIFNLLGL